MNDRHLYKDLDSNEVSWLDNFKGVLRKAPHELRGLIPSSTPSLIPFPVPNKIGWLVSISDITKFDIIKLKLLHILLLHYKYIPDNVSFEDFSNHFINPETPCCEKIPWRGKNYLLPLLFLALQRKKIIPDVENIFETIIDHFSDDKGNDLNKSSLENQASKNGSKKQDNIDDIISFLTCQKS